MLPLAEWKARGTAVEFDEHAYVVSTRRKTQKPVPFLLCVLRVFVVKSQRAFAVKPQRGLVLTSWLINILPTLLTPWKKRAN